MKTHHVRSVIRTALVGGLATVALSVVATSAASAAAPEFKPATKQAFTGTSGVISIERASFSPITCSKGASVGEITGASTVGGLVLTLTGCESKEKAGCEFKSVGAKNNGEIVTKTLAGELGEVKTTQAATGVGLLLQPASGEEWAKIEGPCILASPAKLTGTLAAEVTPIKTLAKTGKLVFVGEAGSNKITKITIKGKVDEPKLRFEGYATSWNTTETLTFNGNEVEIS
jgi:hypothetical protein